MAHTARFYEAYRWKVDLYVPVSSEISDLCEISDLLFLSTILLLRVKK